MANIIILIIFMQCLCKMGHCFLNCFFPCPTPPSPNARYLHFSTTAATNARLKADTYKNIIILIKEPTQRARGINYVERGSHSRPGLLKPCTSLRNVGFSIGPWLAPGR
jgi:hypothetical protein